MRERLDRNQCWTVISITKDVTNFQKFFKCESAFDLEFYHMKKSEMDVVNEIASNRSEFSCKGVAMTITGQRKCQSNLRVVSSEEHKTNSAMPHQVAFPASNNLQFPWAE